MEYKTINGQKVLFPRAYLANSYSTKYKYKGAVITAAESLHLSATTYYI